MNIMQNKIVVILPHPDDEAFGMSGTLAKLIEEGAHVTYACLTLGEMGRNMGNPPFASRITLPAIRKEELIESCRVIGIQDLRLLGYHDKTIEFEDQDKLDKELEGIITEIQPSLVFTFYPGYSVHPDHDATGAAVVRAISRLPQDKRPVVHCVAFAQNVKQALGEPDIAVDVRRHLKQKVASIQAHRSQFYDVIGDKSATDEEVVSRFGKEHFWTYRFDY